MHYWSGEGFFYYTNYSSYWILTIAINSLGAGEIKDGAHDGRKEIIELLSRSENVADIFEFAPSVFAVDPEHALNVRCSPSTLHINTSVLLTYNNTSTQIFTSGPPRGDDRWTDRVLEFLQQYGPAIRMSYLEHVIQKEGNTVRAY